VVIASAPRRPAPSIPTVTSELISSELRALPRARSVLIAPAVRPDFLQKLPGRGADLLFIDCEDAVPATAKVEARATAASATVDLAAQGCSVMTRVNATDSSWFADDVAGLSQEATAVVIPKIETVDQLDVAADRLDQAGHGHLGVVAGIETAVGVYDCRALLEHERVVGAYFGAEDLIADLGGVRTESNHEVAGARSWVALAARIAQVVLWDQVVTNFKNTERFASEASEARNMGYQGKLCIHPAQVEAANVAFTPSPEELARANRLLAAYDDAVRSGLAAIDFEGQMVDEPLAVQARRMIEAAALSQDRPVNRKE